MAREHTFEALYRQYYDFVWRSALRLGVGAESLDDVVQETFLVAYRRLDEFEARSKASTWLFAILANVCRNHRRGRERAARKHLAFHHLEIALHPARGARTELDAQLGLASRLLAGFLVELEPAKREVFVLAELEGMRGREIAAALGLNINTVNSRLRAARQAFERRFDADGPVPALRDQLRRAPPRAPEGERARARALVFAAIPSSEPAVIASVGLGKLLAAFVGVLALGLGLFAVLDFDPGPIAEDSPTVGMTAAPPGTAAATAPDMPDPDPEPEPEPEPEPIVVEASIHSPQLRSAEGPREQLRSDYELFEAARSALGARRPAAALELARRIDARGSLAWERAVTEVGALCELDRAAEAARVAERWSARSGEPPIEPLCW